MKTGVTVLNWNSTLTNNELANNSSIRCCKIINKAVAPNIMKIHKLGLKVAELPMMLITLNAFLYSCKQQKSRECSLQNGNGGDLSFNDSTYGGLNFLQLRLFLRSAMTSGKFECAWNRVLILCVEKLGAPCLPIDSNRWTSFMWLSIDHRLADTNRYQWTNFID